MALGMAGGLAEWLNRDVPATLMWDYPTVDAIADGLATAKSKPPLPPNIVALQSEGDGVPIFCFPGLPGSPMTFISIASKLDPAQPVYGVAVPGFDGKSDSFTSVEAIARAMLREIRIVSPNGPYRLAGYCFGGLLAFEAAQQLVAVGEKVSLLSIYDAFAPTGRVKRPRWQRPFVHLYLMAIGKSLLKDVVGKLRWSHIKRKLQKATPEFWIETNAADADPAKALWNVNSIAAANYLPKSYPGSVILFQATERDTYNHFYKLKPCGGWSDYAQGGVTRIIIPGDHVEIVGPAYANAAAEALRPYLGATAAAVR